MMKERVGDTGCLRQREVISPEGGDTEDSVKKKKPSLKTVVQNKNGGTLFFQASQCLKKREVDSDMTTA